jgi:hypothetical protein
MSMEAKPLSRLGTSAHSAPELRRTSYKLTRRGHSLAQSPRICRARVPVLQGRDLSSVYRRLQTPGPRGTTGTGASTPEPSRTRSPLGRKPGGDERPLHQGRADAARASFRAEHAHVRAPWIARAATFGRVATALCAAPRHPRGTEQKERHPAHSLSAPLRWLRGPVTHSVVRWSLGWRWRW